MALTEAGMLGLYGAVCESVGLEPSLETKEALMTLMALVEKEATRGAVEQFAERVEARARAKIRTGRVMDGAYRQAMRAELKALGGEAS